MEFGLMTEPQLGMTYEEQVDAARFAEAQGLAVFARSDHYGFPGFEAPHATDAFAALAGLARDTTGIGLCVLVSPITFRHPGVIAKTAATIDEMSGGRMILGVGTGWMEHEHEMLGLDFPEFSERFDRLEESLAYIRAALGKAPGGFSGEYYTLTDEEILPGPTGSLPIIVGGGVPKRTPRLAGTFADEYNVFSMGPEGTRDRVARAREAAEAAGRDPDALLISMMGGGVVGSDQASYRRALERAAAAHPFVRTPEQIEERLREVGAPVGTAAEAAEAVGRLTEAGVQRYYLQVLGPVDTDHLAEQFAVLQG
jgi:alkanesulfonate monooxygenase SsuD/methylene tetrahydromethanopterin reductase-like flavin-dependent oxidoreductase (luciferase family)